MSKIGRPPSDTEPVTVRLPRDVIEALDEFRKRQADLPSRPEGIRRLILEQLVDKGYLVK
ncbi:ribbon-helix-helix protein, CopG family [Rhizobium sp. CSW-27]|uniref:ribbon-helix-helix protein, CopG family n=1 Tax=Rhizobium sp. CSW-27 TaxID=2839985 RepID=UPI00338DB478